MNISDELIELIKLAQGDRTLNKFAKDCDVSAGNLSKILRKINPTIPNLTTLHKIAMNAENNVTLIDLMTATGYLPESPAYKKPKAKTTYIINEETEKYKKFLLKHANHLTFNDGNPVSPEMLESFLDSVDIALGIFKIKNRKALK